MIMNIASIESVEGDQETQELGAAHKEGEQPGVEETPVSRIATEPLRSHAKQKANKDIPAAAVDKSKVSEALSSVLQADNIRNEKLTDLGKS